MSLPRSLLEHDAMIYPTIFLYWHKTDLMIPKRDTKIAKSDIQGRRNVTDYLISSLQMGHISFTFCWLEWVEVINRIFPSHQNKSWCIFLYFTTIWARPGARRERSFIIASRPWCTSHLTSQHGSWIIAEIYFLTRLSFAFFRRLLGRKAFGGKSQCQ